MSPIPPPPTVMVVGNVPPPPTPPGMGGNVPPPPIGSTFSTNHPPPSTILSHSTPPPPPQMSSMNTSEREATKPKKKWQTVSTSNTLNLQQAIPHPINHPIEWDHIRNIGLSGSGSSGVFFVETQIPNQVIVVKAPMTLAQEIFGSRIAQLLGLFSPQIRLVEYHPKVTNREQLLKSGAREWIAMKDNMKRVAKNKNDTICEMKVEKELDRAFFMIMEFVEGAVSLEDLMNREELAQQLLVQQHEEVLLDVGKMIVLDIICNNCDRFPMSGIWDHDGNATNILFSSTRSKLVCIDQTLFAISGDDNQQLYVDKLSKFVESLYSTKPCENSYIDDVSRYIYQVTGVMLGVEQKESIHRGIMSAIQILSSSDFALEALEKLKKDIDAMKTGHDWADVWKISVEAINVKWFYENIKILTSKYQTAKD
ncbi:hypothetical protein C9374_005677 [Naegleria lovaniensis]|uniref:Actin-fragmin kinase catalytic domain-containing protein n=1 Tax=Naegleria lovaniensis TaxID=51637 RepID=A0AA88GPV8_NAELO|nr:uncharacterized protein C9374_005677 [Naegleria lovaniensis]KAG2381885.1 hypothetical protein C9374_005677 [Naegleria lovaniensis]